MARNPISVLLRRRLFRREFQRIVDAPWSNPSSSDAGRIRLLNDCIQRAAKLSPFYREHLAEGVGPIGSFDDLNSLPFTTKAQLLEGPDRAVRRSGGRTHPTWGTSGSSGTPFVFSVDQMYATRHEASRAAVYSLCGVHAGVPVVEILSGMAGGGNPARSDPIHRRLVVGYGHGDGIVDRTFAQEPSALYGNRSHLLRMADIVEERGLSVSVDHVISSSEMLYEQDWRRLERVFSARVHDLYGSAESSNIAFRVSRDEPWKCLDPRVVVEIIDADGNHVGTGETGEIVVTTLVEPTSVMIRYRTGDIGTVADGPSDGRAGLRLAEIGGREMDAIFNFHGARADGSVLGGSSFWSSDLLSPHVMQWQVAQSPDRSVEIRLVLSPGSLISDVSAQIEQHIQSVLGSVAVTFAVLERKHLPSDGKFRAVLSIGQAEERMGDS